MHLQSKRFPLLLLLHIISLSSIAQSRRFEWIKTIPGSSGRKLVIDSNKSIIATGDFKGTVDFDAGPAVFNMTSSSTATTSPANDVYITKYDTSGRFIWAKQLGGAFDDGASDMEVDKNGNVLILGFFQATADFDPGPGVQNITTTFASSFLLKLDPNGNFVWVKVLPYPMTQLDIDPAGNIIVGGSFYGAKDFDPGPGTFTATASNMYSDLAVLKLDSGGNFAWMKQIKNAGTSQQQVYGLETDPEGNIYFAGSFSSSMDFDPGAGTANLSSAGSDDGFLLKLDAGGNFAWAKQFGAGGSDKIWGLEVDHNGNVFSTGQFYNSVDFDPGPANYTLSGSGTNRTCFISKLDKNGNFVYAKNLQSGDDWGQSLAIDSSNNLYIAGGFRISVDLDPGPGTYSIAGSGLFTIKLDENGNLAWAAAYKSVGMDAFESIYSSIKVDILKNVYFTSIFFNTVDFDPDPAAYNVTAVSLWDMFIHKLSQCGNSLKIMNAGACNTYSLNSITYSSPGTYYQTLQNSIGCDSIIQLNLARPSVFTQLNTTACDGYTWNGKLLIASGIYRDTFPAATACDSIVQLNLVITKTVVNKKDSACGSYAWNGMQLTGSGLYTHTFKTASGCDSVVNLDLLVKAAPAPFLGNDTAICRSKTITLSPGSFNSYAWSNNSSAGTQTVSDTGTYWVQVTGPNNCTARDSILITRSGQCDCVLEGRVKIYPSPFRGFLMVDKAPTDCEIRMNLYNALGQLLLKDVLVRDGQNKIPLNNLAAGMYFYKFHSGDKTLLTGKVTKQ